MKENLMKHMPMEEDIKALDHLESKEPPPMLGDATRSHKHSRNKMIPNNQRGKQIQTQNIKPWNNQKHPRNL